MNEQSSTIQSVTEEKKGDPEKNWQAKTGLLLGIASFVTWIFPPLSILTGIVAIFFGLFGYQSEKRGAAVTGIIFGLIGIILGIVVAIGIMQAGKKMSDPDFIERVVEDMIGEIEMPIDNSF